VQKLLALAIDCEGCFVYECRKYKNTTYYYPSIIFTNDNKKLINKISKYLKTLGIHFTISHTRKKHYWLRVFDDEAIKLYYLIKPYILVKEFYLR
jgi:hypothetical protein